jgi:hypothetical protein
MIAITANSVPPVIAFARSSVWCMALPIVLTLETLPHERRLLSTFVLTRSPPELRIAV